MWRGTTAKGGGIFGRVNVDIAEKNHKSFETDENGPRVPDVRVWPIKRTLQA